MAQTKSTPKNPWTFIFIAVPLFILGILFPILGNILFWVGEAHYSEGVDQDDETLKINGAGEMALGMIIKDLTIPMILTGIGTVLLGGLWMKIPPTQKYDNCPRCLKRILKYQKFCEHCGLELEWTSPKEKKNDDEE